MASNKELAELLKEPEKGIYSDPEDYVDDIPDSELLADLYEKEPTPELYKERSLIVCGLPIASGKEKTDKLNNLLDKIFSVKGCKDFHKFLLVEDGSSKNYCFVEYPSKTLAETALLALDGFKLDKVHTFRAYHFSALDNCEEPDAKWKEPQPKDYVDVGDLWWYVKNPKCTDQFAIQIQRPGDNDVSLAVYWANSGKDPSAIKFEANWSDSLFKWSPYGTYLATLHKKGIILWAGEKFERCQRFEHNSASFIEFSPKESYIVSYAHDYSKDDKNRKAIKVENALRIYDTFTGERKKAFSPSNKGPDGVHSWPFFKWSFDEQFFGFCRPKAGSMIIYDTSTFKVNSNKPVEIDGLVKFEWNPAKNLIAYYVEERPSSNSPAEIAVIEFPSRERVRAHRIFSVSDANLFWQKSGNYLAAHIEHYSSIRKIKDPKTKQVTSSEFVGVSSHLEIFDFSEKLVAVQSIQLTEPFVAFEWEPKGDRFCVLQGSSNKATPVVYRIDKGKTVPQCISSLEPVFHLNTVSWAPQGGWLAVYAKNSSAGHVLFIDTNGAEATKTRGIEHPGVSYGAWDPTGRYFVTACVGGNSYDTSYRIHTFQGRELFRKRIETLVRFKWRPRPPVNLSEEKILEIRHNIKVTSQRFEEEDRLERQKLLGELRENRKKIMDKFNKLRADHQQRREQEKEERIRLRGGIDTDTIDESNFIEEQLTVIVKSEKTEIEDS